MHMAHRFEKKNRNIYFYKYLFPWPLGFDRFYSEVSSFDQLYQPSISSTFYAHIFCTKFWPKKLQSWNVTRESWAIHFCTKKSRIRCWCNWHLGSPSTSLRAALTHKDPKSAKRHSSHQCLFALLGSALLLV